MRSERKSGCLIILVLLCPFCGLASLFETSDYVITTPIKEWLAQQWMDSIHPDVFTITDDDMLEVIREPKIGADGTMRCVGATAIQVFGTDRPYEEVIAEYTSWAETEGWPIAQMSDEAKARGVVRIDVPHNIYSRWFDTFRAFLVQPYQNDGQWEFETVYQITLHFSESRCLP